MAFLGKGPSRHHSPAEITVPATLCVVVLKKTKRFDACMNTGWRPPNAAWEPGVSTTPCTASGEIPTTDLRKQWLQSHWPHVVMTGQLGHKTNRFGHRLRTQSYCSSDYHSPCVEQHLHYAGSSGKQAPSLGDILPKTLAQGRRLSEGHHSWIIAALADAEERAGARSMPH